MLGSGALPIPLSDRLSTRQSSPVRVSGTSSSSPSAPSYCLQDARHPSAQFWRCAPEEDVLVQDQLDGGEDVEGVVHNQGLSYVPEVIRIELTSRTLRHQENSRTRCQEILWRPAVALNTCPLLGGHQLRLNPHHRWPAKMVHSKPAQMIDAPGLAEVFIDLTVRHGLPWPPRLDCTSRLSCHLKVLVFSVLLPRRQANYDSILVVDRLKKMLRNESVQIPIDAPRLPDSIVRD